MSEQESAGADRVCILLATWNGAAYLPEQLESFVAQSHANWELRVGDDGSRDASGTILADFSARMQAQGRRVTLRAGPGRGATANFLTLLAETPAGAPVALSDQDDVWFPDRLARGMVALAETPGDVPVLYCSRTQVTDVALRPRHLSRPLRRPTGFRNALVQNIAAGNTILLNPAAAALARAAAPAALEVSDLPAHDWWLYQLVSGAGGRVVFDPEPTLFYRQHGANEVGANRGIRAGMTRAGMVMRGRLRSWNTANIAALRAAAAHLAPDNRELVEEYATLRALPLPLRLRSFRRLQLYRQTCLGQAVFWLALIAGRL